jgi:hypothetical protein
MITTLEKAFHAFSLGMIFMLMMSLLEAQIPPEPSELVSEMESFVAVLKITGLVYGFVAIALVVLGLLSPWGRCAQFSKWLQNNSAKVSFVFNLASFAVVSYFIGWFWAIPC